MADQKVTDLTALSSLATGDTMYIVDVSDTTDGASGSSKKTLLSTITTYIASLAETLTNKTLTSPVINTGISGTAITDEDDMVSDSATKVPTEQSVKAYVDSGTVTMTNKTLTSPKIGTAILDTNGNEVIKTPATASAVNEVTITNSATGNHPIVSATGGDTNIDLLLRSKGTGSARHSGTYDGWVDANETWTYASASTITIPAGGASRYAKGDRLKFTQTTVKYAVVITVADTLLTIAVNNDYTVANAAITANYYSHEMNPLDYPHWFGYDPTYTGFSSSPTADQQYRIDGNMITIRFVATGTSNSATFNMTVPVTPLTIGGASEQFIVLVVDNSTRPNQVGVIGILHSSADLKVGINPASSGGNVYGGFTTSGTKGLEGTVLFKF